MGDFRIPYGFARGFKNNFYARTDHLFTSGDTTPDVTIGNLWYTNNSSATVITDFDLTGLPTAGLAADYEGKYFTLFTLDANTTVVNNSRINLTTSAQTLGANQNITFLYHNSAWFETARGRNVSGGDSQTFTFAGTAGINVTDVKLAILVGTAASVSIKSLSGGTVGQTVTLFANVTNGITVQIDTGGNIYMPGTSSILLNASGGYPIIKVDGTRWVVIRPVA